MSFVQMLDLLFHIELITALGSLPFHPVGGTGTPRPLPFPLDLQRVGGSLLGRLASHNWLLEFASARNW